MKKILALGLALATLGLSQTASAYQLQDYNGQCNPGLQWSSFPVKWWLNSTGSDNLSFGTVETIMKDSFAAWEAPCCTNFTSSYQGTTSKTAYNSGGDVVLSFVEDAWDQSWGPIDSVIGVTLTSFDPSRCRILNAPIVFNGVRFQFTQGGSGTDLQSIATHEIGHLTGLDHSQIYEATMYAAYVGGSGARTLHSDDINGVCALYTRPCSCQTANDCLQGDICRNGTCVDVPCTSNSDCQTGLECNVISGECEVPPCQSDNDCPGGFYCQPDGDCASLCPVCRDCETNSDCGSTGVCVTDVGKCLTYCQNGACPGDSQCFNLNGTAVCLNPNVNETSICPDDYVCMSEPVLECTTDIDCAVGEYCDSNNECQTGQDPCANISCGSGESCVNGVCVGESSNNANNTNPNNSTGNNVNTGNNANSANSANTGNNATGNNSGNNGTDPDVIVFVDDPVDEDDGCSAAGGEGDASWLALAGLALVSMVRRRR